MTRLNGGRFKKTFLIIDVVLILGLFPFLMYALANR
jgi:hypothetical protein